MPAVQYNHMSLAVGTTALACAADHRVVRYKYDMNATKLAEANLLIFGAPQLKFTANEVRIFLFTIQDGMSRPVSVVLSCPFQKENGAVPCLCSKHTRTQTQIRT